MQKLKILVFDDKEINRKTAALTLKGHDITVVGTYDKAERALLQKRKTIHPNFDVVMTDLLVPGSMLEVDKYEWAGKEMPLGTTIALLALAVGVKNVAVVTYVSHHKHPASAAFDCFDELPSTPSGIKLFCTNHFGQMMVDKKTGEEITEEFERSEAGQRKYPFGEPLEKRKAIAKDWGRVLRKLLGEEEK